MWLNEATLDTSHKISFEPRDLARPGAAIKMKASLRIFTSFMTSSRAARLERGPARLFRSEQPELKNDVVPKSFDLVLQKQFLALQFRDLQVVCRAMG
jgi:hypothetical protein